NSSSLTWAPRRSSSITRWKEPSPSWNLSCRYAVQPLTNALSSFGANSPAFGNVITGVAGTLVLVRDGHVGGSGRALRVAVLAVVKARPGETHRSRRSTRGVHGVPGTRDPGRQAHARLGDVEVDPATEVHALVEAETQRGRCGA